MQKTSHNRIKNRNIGFIIIVCSIIVIVVILVISLRYPKKNGCGAELGSLAYIEIWKLGENIDSVKLSENDNKLWLTTRFRLSRENEYPGETPEYEIVLFIGNRNYTAIYNKGSKFIWFSFIPEFKYTYGWLSSPSPGGWKQPLYITDTTPELLNMFRMSR